MYCMSTGDFNWSYDKFTSEVFICYIHVHDVVRLWMDPWERAPILLLAKGLKIEGFFFASSGSRSSLVQFSVNLV